MNVVTDVCGNDMTKEPELNGCTGESRISAEFHNAPPPPDPKCVLLSVQKDGHHDGLVGLDIIMDLALALINNLLLDAPSLLPHLLPSAQDSTDELLAVIALQFSMKEVVMAAQVDEHLISDGGEAEDVDDLLEGVGLAVQFTRITSLRQEAEKGNHLPW
ncbi:hypothetical protein EDB89DRAFT_1906865 [Lactarius sanguifluus]|nr:hypothetical protein EDB89DRAFT_1906865 [Lactarius sanguifluus]